MMDKRVIRMIVVGTDKLFEFRTKHANARSAINNWLADARGAKWKSSHDIKARYSQASFLGFNVVIFNIKGNSYRLETSVVYATDTTDGVVQINWVGTHAEYSKRDF